MVPKIISVKEARALDPSGAVRQVINLQWTLGPHGPFTLVTTQAEIANGTAIQKINQQASSLQTLPLQTTA